MKTPFSNNFDHAKRALFNILLAFLLAKIILRYMFYMFYKSVEAISDKFEYAEGGFPYSHIAISLCHRKC